MKAGSGGTHKGSFQGSLPFLRVPGGSSMTFFDPEHRSQNASLHHQFLSLQGSKSGNVAVLVVMIR